MEGDRPIKLSNGSRMQKKRVERQDVESGRFCKSVSQHNYYQNYYGRMKHHYTDIYCGKFGYEEAQCMHPVLKELKDTFDSKLQKCFPDEFKKKLGRKEKYQRASELGFKPKRNPVLNMFQKLDRRLLMPVLREAFINIKSQVEQKKKRQCFMQFDFSLYY